jgi:hypothetical protein
MERLCKLLGMLGSTSGGERANVCALADKRYAHILNDWKTKFLRNVNGRSSFSAKQRAVITRIITKVREHELCNA